MVSMKTDESNECCAPSSNPYGHGLRIRLNEGQCEALGITTPPKAGSKMSISAATFVTEATTRVEDDGDDAGPDIYLELQITDMEISDSGKSAASVLYGD
jgi:hypothetical protein